MSERKRCIRCERPIDEWARICPFCNWNQTQPVPAQAPAPPIEVAEYQPPAERSLKKNMIIAGSGVLLLVISFAIGMIINRDGAPKNAPEPVTETDGQTISAPKRADTPLVPMNEPGGFEQPITSAPAVAAEDGAAANDWDRSDATAVSAAEYAQLARRAQAEKKKTTLVDPRSLTGPAYAQGTPAPQRRMEPATASQPQRVAMTTRPVPRYQPLPSIRGSGSARLDLTIGPDGRVRNIAIRRPLRGNNAALIGAVQSWRFKPATQNGRPVTAPYSVEISFNRHE